MHIEVDLPPVETWTKRVLIAAGVPDESKYTEFAIRGARSELAYGMGICGTLMSRLLCIRHQCGSTDAAIHRKLKRYGKRYRLIAELS